LVPEFSDEFEATDDGRYIMLPVNTTKWATNVTSWGNWTWEPENVKIVANVSGMSKATVEGTTGSYAALTMTYEEHQRKPNGPTYFYKSAIMKSTLPAGIVYGRFEARIKGASVWPGVCPAFWAWRNGGNYWTELDFVEMTEAIGNVKDIDFTTHVFPPTPGVPKEISNSTHAVFGFDPRDDFHVYVMEWNSSLLTWWVDGELIKQLPAAPHFNRADRPMDVALSFGLRPPLKMKPDSVGFPTTFYVDWVRTWQRV
jgi:beta-glucanase (GH16 family)